jgi:FKBP12-rapamycin complex-associated protein
MLSRFKEVCDTVMEYKDHKDALVRETVIALLPKLASFEPEAFVRGYLTTSLAYIIATLKKKDIEGNSRSIAFTSLGEMSLAVKENIISQLDVIVPLVKEGLVTPPPKPTSSSSAANKSSSKSFPANKALTCVSMLAKAVGPKLANHLKDLVGMSVIHHHQ